VYVTRDQVEAMILGHRVAALAPMVRERTSTLQQAGTPDMNNMVAAKVNEDATVLQAGGFSVSLPQGRRASLRARPTGPPPRRWAARSRSSKPSGAM